MESGRSGDLSLVAERKESIAWFMWLIQSMVLERTCMSCSIWKGAGHSGGDENSGFIGILTSTTTGGNWDAMNKMIVA